MTSSCTHASTGRLPFGGLHRLSFLEQRSLVKSPSVTYLQCTPSFVHRGPNVGSSSKAPSNFSA
jgi:hypothetical protein